MGVGGRHPVIVDAHIHFWRLARGDNTALLPSMAPIHADHEPELLKPQLDACGIDRIVVVQAAETLAENLYTLGLAARFPWIAGVVGWCDLASPSLDEEIEALRSTGKLKGFRPVRDDNRSIAWLLDRRLASGLEAIAKRCLTLDLLVQNPDEIPLISCLARFHPSLTLVLDHGGKPDIVGGRFQPWARDIDELAALPNVVCKLSGLPNQAARGAGADVLEPYARHVLDRFGPDRVLWASDWPPVLLSGIDYAGWWRLTTELLAALSAEERAAVLGGTAQRIYRLEER